MKTLMIMIVNCFCGMAYLFDKSHITIPSKETFQTILVLQVLKMSVVSRISHYLVARAEPMT